MKAWDLHFSALIIVFQCSLTSFLKMYLVLYKLLMVFNLSFRARVKLLGKQQEAKILREALLKLVNNAILIIIDEI